jgi:hypothetical protein
MEEELSKWEDDVKGQRDSFYELNYYTTVQLLTLRRELGKLKDSSKSASISPEVLALLQSISSEVSDSHVSGALNEVLVEPKREPEPAVAMEMHPDSPDKAEAGNIAEVSLSAADDVSGDVDPLEPKEDGDTDQAPMLSEDDLSEELRGYVATISFRFSYSRQLVLKAIEVLGKDSTQIDYEKWCVENDDNYSFEGQEASSDEDSESDSDSSGTTSSDDEDNEFNYMPGIFFSEQSLSKNCDLF